MTPSATITLTLVEGRMKPGAYVFEERTTRVLGRSTDCSPRLPDDPDQRHQRRPQGGLRGLSHHLRRCG
ncbi:hypothetical protein VT50_0207385 [Streptomyces antioxidans]|uniref:Uncharacterized protein n=1 Tax=Streptomyces antioxidans TaxID=1507734 RepID=A0A1V4DAA8_9ACTN|nr:hypothetical protein [Streptomyces antioxidans]OPF82360.1 hypothetical protein VT50_0207385 [Streptomyces antioxidans]